MPYPRNPRRSPTHQSILILAAAVLLMVACQDSAGPPSTLEAGVVDFEYVGPIASGSFAADGRCYETAGYPTADTACALAMDRGDTILIRASLHPRTIRWQHMNLRIPADGECGADGCAIALDYLNRGGTVLQQLRSTEAAVIIEEAADGRLRGTFTGLLYRVGGLDRDTMRIDSGVFDVPVVP